ncbi:MAG TPA: hypothetical protein VGI39_24400 [Polyangiaceae bacterium]
MFLRALAVSALPCVACLTCLTSLGCSSGDDNGSTTPIADASQPPPTKFEAGASCLTSNDCQTGLVCLFPTTTCSAFAVCAPAPLSPCDNPQTACSCLGETIDTCDGYAVDPISAMGACGDSGVKPPMEAGSTDTGAPPVDAGTPDTGAPPVDGGGDAAPPADSGSADATGE